jgi:hypothetical protein
MIRFAHLAGCKYAASKTRTFGRRSNQGATPVSLLGNCYSDHLFHGAHGLLHRIALNHAFVTAAGAGRRFNPDRGKPARPA